MRQLAGSFLLVVLAATLAGCGASGSTDPKATTVLVYMMGTDLESKWGNGTANLNEMMRVGTTARTNVVVQTGGADKGPELPVTDPGAMLPASIDWRRIQRYRVNPGSLQRLDDLGAEDVATPRRDMGNHVTLQDFVDWGVGAYPAQRYVVVLWDHGGGVNVGVGGDSITGSTLSVPAIAEVLGAVAASRTIQFEVVGFDACFMATAEVAAALVPSARYFVASEDMEPGSGWDYVSFLTFVDENPTATGGQIGTDIATSYATKQRHDDITLSVTDLSRVPALVTALGTFSSALAPYSTRVDGWKQIARARARSLDWWSSPVSPRNLDLVDMDALVANVVERITTEIGADATLQAAGTALRAAIAAAVVQNSTSGSNQNATGLSLYFPAIVVTYPSQGYAASTSKAGVPYFSTRYTDGRDGLLAGYFDFLYENLDALSASVELAPEPGYPLAATISNDFDVALAAHQVASCRLYDHQGDPLPDGPCFDGMRVADAIPHSPAGSWWMSFAFTDGWPWLADSQGNRFPVALTPDHYAEGRIGVANRYLIPAWRAYLESGSTRHERGFLVAEEALPAAPGPSTYEVRAFVPSGDADWTDRSEPLEDGDTFALGSYAASATGNAYLRSDRTLRATGGTLTLTLEPITGGKFGYFVTDLTGAVRSSAVVDFVAVP